MKIEVKDLLISGIGVSPGVAIGRAVVLHRAGEVCPERPIAAEEVPAELERFAAAVALSRQQLLEVRRQAESYPAPEPKLIIDAHLLILEDEMLVAGTRERIAEAEIDAEGALRRTLAEIHRLFAGMADDYLRERGSDVEFVGQRILRNLVGQHDPDLQMADSPAVLVAHDLSPADTLQLDRTRILALVTDGGGRTSHTAILARSLGIPAVVGCENASRLIEGGMPLIVDGEAGTVIAEPSAASFRNGLLRKQQYEYRLANLEALRDLPAATRDRFGVALRANLDHPDEAATALSRGATGVGLMRTEFLYMNRIDPPGEEEQYAVYCAMLQRMAPEPVLIRTLDVGGDKFAAGLNLAGEANPALGLRAVRFSLREEQLFLTQLCAILRASAHGPVRIAFPMISGVDELRRCRTLLSAAMSDLRRRNLAFDEKIATGIIVEVPSAALIADLLAAEVDFFSIGTNDLIQYCLAADRGNEHLAYLYDPLHPAVLRALRQVCAAAADAGIPVAMCGEMAAEPLFAPVLVALGITELSMNPCDILQMKQAVRALNKSDCEALVSRLLSLSTGDEIRAALQKFSLAAAASNPEIR